jgi:hypothetical protein
MRDGATYWGRRQIWWGFIAKTALPLDELRIELVINAVVYSTFTLFPVTVIPLCDLLL